MVTALAVGTVVFLVLAMVALITSNTLGNRFQSVALLVLGLLWLGNSIAWGLTEGFGSWDVAYVSTGGAAAAFGAFESWRHRREPFQRPTRKHWLRWAFWVAGWVLVLVLSYAIGNWTVLVIGAGLVATLLYRRRRRSGMS